MAGMADTVLRGTDQVLGARNGVANALGVLGNRKAQERALREERSRRAFDQIGQTVNNFATFQNEKRAEDEQKGLTDAFMAGMSSGDEKAAWQAVAAAPSNTREGAKLKVDLGLKVLDIAQKKRAEEHQRIANEKITQALELEKAGRAAVSKAVRPVETAAPPVSAEGGIDIESSLLGMDAAQSPNVMIRRNPTEDEIVQRLAEAGQLGPDDLMKHFQKQIPLDVADKQAESRAAIAAANAASKAALQEAEGRRRAALVKLRAEEARATAKAAFELNRPIEERKVAAQELAAKARSRQATAAELRYGLDAAVKEFDSEIEISREDRLRLSTFIDDSNANLDDMRKLINQKISYLIASGTDIEDALADPEVTELSQDISAAQKAADVMREKLLKLKSPEPMKAPAGGAGGASGRERKTNILGTFEKADDGSWVKVTK